APDHGELRRAGLDRDRDARRRRPRGARGARADAAPRHAGGRRRRGLVPVLAGRLLRHRPGALGERGDPVSRAGERAVDVAILGGGLAGGLLARQLRLSVPELRIALFEQETAGAAKVGEATVEIAANYLVRRLGLSTYLYEQQLPKNGLRYFFDTPERDCPLERMSEVGSVSLPFHPAFQLDRARPESDLLAINRRDGGLVRGGARVRSVEVGSGGAPHRFEVEDESGSGAWSARWLVDATGRRGALARRQGLRRLRSDHRLGSVWGRFENVADIDALGPAEFRE